MAGSDHRGRYLWACSKSIRSGVMPGKKLRFDCRSGSGWRRPNALPLLQAPGENTLLGMQPVLGLVPNYRLRAVDDPRGDLLATFCWQAMHEDRVWLGLGHKQLVDPISRQHVVAGVARVPPPADPRGTHGTNPTGGTPPSVASPICAPP